MLSFDVPLCRIGSNVGDKLLGDCNTPFGVYYTPGGYGKMDVASHLVCDVERFISDEAYVACTNNNLIRLRRISAFPQGRSLIKKFFSGILELIVLMISISCLLLGNYSSDINLYVTHKGVPAFYINEDGYIVQPLKNTTVGQYPQVISLKAFAPGTYEWKAKIVAPEEDKTFWVGFGELWSSNNAAASIMIYRTGDITKFSTTVASNHTITDISAWIDLTNLTTLKIVWVAGTSVTLYINGILRVTHEINIPSIPLHTFIEVHHASIRINHSMVLVQEGLFNGDALVEEKRR